jgi:nucleotide-binding universal stress UspA family protein
VSEGLGGLVDEILVPLPAPDPADRGVRAAAWLADASGCPLRLLHVRLPGRPEPDPGALLAGLGRPVEWDVTDADDVAPAVLGRARPGSLIVMATQHANRWSGKDSVSEHVLDRWPGAAMLVGPRADLAERTGGRVVVGLDGSPRAEQAVRIASALARSLGGELVLAQVVPDDPDGATSEQGAQGYLQALAATTGVPSSTRVVRSNDPISALVAVAGAEADAIVLSSRGDRASGRATISRVCTGVAADAGQPVVVVGPGSG